MTLCPVCIWSPSCETQGSSPVLGPGGGAVPSLLPLQTWGLTVTRGRAAGGPPKEDHSAGPEAVWRARAWGQGRQGHAPLPPGPVLRVEPWAQRGVVAGVPAPELHAPSRPRSCGVRPGKCRCDGSAGL